MKIKVKCPASCGELLQGRIGNSEKLISYPIDLYSEVILEETKKPKLDKMRYKAYKAIKKVIYYFKEDERILNHLNLNIHSQIPVEKGMASSTADIAASIVAMTHYLGKSLSEEHIAKICAEVEPTDSTVFEKLTLFNHLKGTKIEDFDWNVDLDVLVLENKDTINTQKFRMTDYEALRKKNQKMVQRAYELFKKGYIQKDLSFFGQAATMSALANQDILYKDKLEELILCADQFRCVGVNIAHSGTVMGVLLNRDQVDVEKLLAVMKDKNILMDDDKYYLRKIVPGGAKLME